MLHTIKRALISVSDKTGLPELAKFLKDQQVEVISTGGTAKMLRELGLHVKDISEHTGFPEIMDGRVKTLHPKVHGGLLGRRDLATHTDAMDTHGIGPIDLVVVNLYPFEATVARGASYEEAIENIDIGGPSMIRSAAKNHDFVTVLVDPADYPHVMQEMILHKGATDSPLRRRLAAKAYSRTASYDSAISQWFARQQQETFPELLTISAHRQEELRYGENSHQKAALYIRKNDTGGIAHAQQLQGKELSYNNLHDADAALELISEFTDPVAAIIKHTNPCGIATGASLEEAYDKALACDPVSAFGGIVAVNRPLDAATAEKLAALFLEVVIAPEITKEARELLAAKKNLRVLLAQPIPQGQRSLVVKNISGGLLVQERDFETISEAELEVVTKRKPTPAEIHDLLFAFRVCKHVKSNAIVFAKDGATIGVGAGQMSRVDSVKMAAIKAAEGKDSQRAKGAVVASDAFFPFADGLILAAEAGITAAIQPGGSVRDNEVIAAANERDIAMVITHKRHFKH